MNTRATDLTPSHADVLYLLVIGAQRLSITHDLYLSARTVDQRIADLKRTFGTSDRFGLGISAIRRRVIDPAYAINNASARRVSIDWVPPTERQFEILHLRATGASVGEVATKIGLSVYTVRRYIRRLAADNGARNAISAGALFEALGWNHPPDRA